LNPLTRRRLLKLRSLGAALVIMTALAVSLTGAMIGISYLILYADQREDISIISSK
jgi:hypothetical protein